MYSTIITAVTKLVVGIKVITFETIGYVIDAVENTEKGNVVYVDGLVSYNTNSKLLPWRTISGTKYSLLLQTTEAKDIVQEYGLKEGDVFLGRVDNYILFTNASNSIRINCQSISVTSNTFELTAQEGKLNIGGGTLSVLEGKLLWNGVEVAVVGATTVGSPTTQTVTVSGQ